jgi:hypothetical protein
MRGTMAGMRMWLILLAVAIPLGFIWSLCGRLNLGAPVYYTVGALSGLLFFWIVNLNERRFPLRTALIASALVLILLWLVVFAASK